MAQGRTTHHIQHHIEPHKGWPHGEQPSGWPGTDPALNVRDEYDRIQAEKGQERKR